MTDDEFKPRPVAPPRPAMPINPNTAAPPMDEPVPVAPNNDRMGPAPTYATAHLFADPERSARAKRAWETRRKRHVGKHPALGAPYGKDRHAVGDHPFDAAIAELYRQRVLIDEAIKMLEDRRKP